MIDIPVWAGFTGIIVILCLLGWVMLLDGRINQLEGYIKRLERHIDGEIISNFKRR